MRADTGMLSASAAEVASSVCRLQVERPLWAPPSGPIAILDPVSGLAVRLAHVRLDGTLALEEIGTGALAPTDAAAPVAQLAEALGDEVGPIAAGNLTITHNGAVLDQLPGVNYVPPPSATASPPADNFTRWVRTIPNAVRLTFAPNTE